MTNEYGLDSNYFKSKLNLIVRDIEHYSPREMYIELTKLADVAQSSSYNKQDIFEAMKIENYKESMRLSGMNIEEIIEQGEDE